MSGQAELALKVRKQLDRVPGRRALPRKDCRPCDWRDGGEDRLPATLEQRVLVALLCRRPHLPELNLKTGAAKCEPAKLSRVGIAQRSENVPV